MSIAGVVLAAGFSRRLGRPKQTVEIGGETLIQRAVRVAVEAGLQPVLVVVNNGASFTRLLQQAGCIVVVNDEAEEGIASSIRAGVRTVSNTDVHGLVLMTCDQITTTADHLRALCAEPDAVTGSAYSGRIAVPAYFPKRVFDRLLGLSGDTGARDLLREARHVEAESLVVDVDTEEDLARARSFFA